jgi:hypothetical protein
MIITVYYNRSYVNMIFLSKYFISTFSLKGSTCASIATLVLWGHSVKKGPLNLKHWDDTSV